MLCTPLAVIAPTCFDNTFSQYSTSRSASLRIPCTPSKADKGSDIPSALRKAIVSLGVAKRESVANLFSLSSIFSGLVMPKFKNTIDHFSPLNPCFAK